MSVREGYKVVRIVAPHPALSAARWSAVVGVDGWLYLSEVRYAPGEWAFPCPWSGPLCVFTSAAAARTFLFNQMAGREVWYGEMWRCRYVPSRSLRVWGTEDDYEVNRQIRVGLPDATELAHAVQLTRLIADDAEWEA